MGARALSSTNGFVGRERELSELRAALEDANAGHGRLFLLSGEPGIGKTRLAEEIAREATTRGMRAHWGRCWEGGGAPAYWPWVQILRSLILDSSRARVRLPIVASDIAQLIPELSSEGQRPAESDPERARFRLYDAVATFLKESGRSQPLVLIIDDMHEADQSSLQILNFIGRTLSESHVVVIGTYRDAEVRRSSVLSEEIGEIARHSHQILLPGLAAGDISRMVEQRAERLPSAAFVSALNLATAGNPLFVDGIVQVLIAEGKLGSAEYLDLSGIKLPEGVRGAIRKRLAMLSEPAREVLIFAAVIGQEFDSALLGRRSESGEVFLPDLVAEGIEIGVLVTIGSDHYRFTHPLVREALYNEPSSVDRARLHRLIAEELAKNYASDPINLAQLALHYRLSGEVEKAIEYSIRAGDAASATFAFQEAIAQWSAALELAERAAPDEMRKAEIMFRLGEPLARGGGVLGIEYLERALGIYERLGVPEKAALLHAWLAKYRAGNWETMDLARAREHCAKADELLGGKPHEALSRAYHALAWIEIWKANQAAGLFAARRALQIAEDLNEERLKAGALAALASGLWGSGKLCEAFDTFELSWTLGDKWNELPAIGNALSAGSFSFSWSRDHRALKSWVYRELVKPRQKQNPGRGILLHFACIGHAFAGELIETNRVQSECQSRDRGLAELNSAWVNYMTGDLEGAESRFRSLRKFARQQGRRENTCCYGIEIGGLQINLGRYESALESFREVLAIADDGGYVPFQLNALECLGHTSVLMGRLDEARAALARCHEIVADGEDWRGLAGYVARTEALLAAAESNRVVAESKFVEAVQILGRYECFWETILTVMDWGRYLVAAGKSEEAKEKFDRTIEVLRQRGADQRWIDRVEAARPSSGKPVSGKLENNQFLREGAYWTVIYEGRLFRLKDSKGVRYLGRLLQNPNREFHVFDLINTEQDGLNRTGATRVSAVVGDAGEVLDSTARAEYSSRLEELKSELDEAERFNDLGRGARARDEMETIANQLVGGFGLGGRARKAASNSERARLAVTKRIKSAITQIRDTDSGLGRHLSAFISTGTFCSYRPDPDRPIHWTF